MSKIYGPEEISNYQERQYRCEFLPQPDGPTHFPSKYAGMRRNPLGMAEITAQISPPIPIEMQRDAAESTGNHHFQRNPLELAGQQSRLLKSVIPIGPALDAGGTRCRLLPISRLPPPRILLTPAITKFQAARAANRNSKC
ncbi:hypothetical protein B0H16DRAFT_1485633 [Mycena metata]|uniref:Uncharacterized protein n=1 Tax=Mycena metata TaxID=1033252 RepID=A0AAD7DNE3_9AGAR|nr:hypothetical protein B0H16DRAFT_1485633 [Mycena metata]